MTTTSALLEWCCCGRRLNPIQRPGTADLQLRGCDGKSKATGELSDGESGDVEGARKHWAAAAEDLGAEPQGKDAAGHSIPSSRTTSERSSKAQLFFPDPDAREISPVTVDVETATAEVGRIEVKLPFKTTDTSDSVISQEEAAGSSRVVLSDATEEDTRSSASLFNCDSREHEGFPENAGEAHEERVSDAGLHGAEQQTLEGKVSGNGVAQIDDLYLDIRHVTKTPPSTPELPETNRIVRQKEPEKSSEGLSVPDTTLQNEEGCLTPPATPTEHLEAPSTESQAEANSELRLVGNVIKTHQPAALDSIDKSTAGLETTLPALTVAEEDNGFVQAGTTSMKHLSSFENKRRLGEANPAVDDPSDLQSASASETEVWRDAVADSDAGVVHVSHHTEDESEPGRGNSKHSEGLVDIQNDAPSGGANGSRTDSLQSSTENSPACRFVSSSQPPAVDGAMLASKGKRGRGARRGRR